MYIVHVFIHVRPEWLEDFIAAAPDNATHSSQEPGIARFDFIQQVDDPTRFVLVEVYRDEQASARHKETDHYFRWRDRVADMMAEPRVGVRYNNLYPDDAGW